MKSRLVLSLLLFTQCVAAQPLSKKLAAAYQVFQNDPQLEYGQASLTVLNGQTGAVIFSENGSTGLAPASTLKTVTSATGFYLLGQDFRWQTSLGYAGTIAGNTLKGDLIIKGSGDPTLGSNRYDQTKPDVLLARWADAVKKAGIKRIEGRIIVDDSLFGTQLTPMGWIWQDIGNYYGAGATSASWRENEFGLVFKPGAKAGQPAVFVRSQPDMPGLKIVNEVTTGAAGSGDNVYAYSAPYSDVIYVRGTYGIDLSKTIMVSVPDAALRLAMDLRDQLSRNNVNLVGAATTSRIVSAENGALRKEFNTIDLYNSPALSEVVYWLNQKSLNLYAENILKTIALKQGHPATFEEGVNVLQDFWKQKAGIDPKSINVLDGSGLSPENRVTTASMARILFYSQKEPWFDHFYNSLPLYNNMKMKSGSIRNVLCYAGYERNSSGIPLVFSLIVNNYNGSTSSVKQKMFKLLDTLK